MPDPVSSSHSPPNACPLSDEDPLMSLDPSVSGGMSVAPPPQPKPTPGGPVFPTATPASLVSGAKVLVAGHATVTAKGAIGVLTPAGAGNVGGRIAVAEGSITVTDTSSKSRTTAQGARSVVEVNVGTQNVDGSQGAHLKAGAAIYSAEVTTGTPGFELTLGADLGIGLEASSGERDLDGDGRTEYCFRAGSSLLAGFCAEPAQLLADAKDAVEVLQSIVTATRHPGMLP